MEIGFKLRVLVRQPPKKKKLSKFQLFPLLSWFHDLAVCNIRCTEETPYMHADASWPMVRMQVAPESHITISCILKPMVQPNPMDMCEPDAHFTDS